MEKKFVEVQDYRREQSSQLADISARLKEIHSALEKTYREALLMPQRFYRNTSLYRT